MWLDFISLVCRNLLTSSWISHRAILSVCSVKSPWRKENLGLPILPSCWFYFPGPPFLCVCVLCLVTQSCSTFCDPMDCSLPDSSIHGDSLGKNTGVGCHTLLQGMSPAQVPLFLGDAENSLTNVHLYSFQPKHIKPQRMALKINLYRFLPIYL